MYDNSYDAFRQMHPLTNFIYLMTVLLVVVVPAHPIFKLLGLIGGILYAFYQVRWQAIKSVLLSIPMALLVAVINPLFSHQGVTVLAHFPSGNALTLESIYYGLYNGLMVLALLVWCSIFSRVMSTDKWIQLLGKTVPYIALLFSMILGFLPKLKRQYPEFSYRSNGENAFQKFGMLLTWGLENAVITADSMSARGYGLSRKRSHYRLHPTRRGDRIWGCVFLLFAICFAYFFGTGHLSYIFYPQITVLGEPFAMRVCSVLFGCYCLLPVVICIKEDVRWTLLRKKSMKSNS